MTRKSILVLATIAALSTTSLVSTDAAARSASHMARASSQRHAAVRPFNRHVIAPVAANRRRVAVHSQSNGSGGHKTGASSGHSTTGQNGTGHVPQTPNAALKNRSHVFAGTDKTANGSSQTPANGITKADAKKAAELFEKGHDAQARAKAETATAKSDREQAQAARDEEARLQRAADQKTQAALNSGNFKAYAPGIKKDLADAAVQKQKAEQLEADAAKKTEYAAINRGVARRDIAGANKLLDGGKGSSGSDGGGGGKGPSGSDGSGGGKRPPSDGSAGGSGPSGATSGGSGGGTAGFDPSTMMPQQPSGPTGSSTSGQDQPDYGQGQATAPRPGISPRPLYRPVPPSPQVVAAPNCLQKTYLQGGMVMFNDVCAQQWAVNASSVTTQVAANPGCLTKENPQNGVVLFKDLCTNEWAMNPPSVGNQARTN